MQQLEKLSIDDLEVCENFQLREIRKVKQKKSFTLPTTTTTTTTTTNGASQNVSSFNQQKLNRIKKMIFNFRFLTIFAKN